MNRHTGGRCPNPLVFLVAAISANFSGVASSNSGIVFTDIASDPDNGLVYQRHPSSSEAILQAFKIQPLFYDIFSIEPANLAAIAPMPIETRGFPGAAVFDYDGDGDLDIYVSNGPGVNNSLFSNQLKESGAFRFEDVAAVAGVAVTEQDSSGVCFGDIDNDGDHDLVVLGLTEPNKLFENLGNGSFVEITDSSGIAVRSDNSTSCSMGDVNGDGLLDIAIANSMPNHDSVAWWIEHYALNQHNELYINRGDNTFDDVSSESGIQDLAGLPPEAAGSAGVTWAIALVDYDLDGDVDILTAEDQVFSFPTNVLPAEDGGADRGYVRVFKNDGDGNFTDVRIEAGVNSRGEYMGLSFGDLNSDGNMDFFATNAGDYAVHTFYTTQKGLPYYLGDSASRWFLGQSDGTFLDPGVGDLVATPFGWGTSMLDYNNDGDTDIVFYGDVDAQTVATATNPGAILQNDGNANFSYDSTAIPTNHSRRNVHGLATGDLNMDGFVDIVSVSSFDRPEPIPFLSMGLEFGGPFDAFGNMVPNFFPNPETGALSWTGIVYPNGSLSVEMNSADNGNHWVEVAVKGTVGISDEGKVNRDGIGAVVSFTPEDGNTVMQPVLGGSSHLSQDSLAQNFGMGEEDEGMVEVMWPGGVRNRLYDVHASERIMFPEIPCSYDAEWDRRSDYVHCVRGALREIVSAGLLTRKEANRFSRSAMEAFGRGHSESHRHDSDDDDYDDSDDD